MIDPATVRQGAAGALSSTQKARLIYEEARSDMARGLWKAALGSVDDREEGRIGTDAAGPQHLGLDRLLSILNPEARAALDRAMEPAAPAPAAEPMDAGAGSAVAGMQDGPNGRYAAMLDAAAQRSGLPASAIAAIVDAEAAKGPGGTWQPYSRNPRSSAAGLGQFLSRTWEGEAERSGTWLNRTAQERGWLDGAGQVRAGARGALLSLRYDPRASIEAVADYASANVAALRRGGARIGAATHEVARAAYLGHHLGVGDAKRFLAGGLSPERARMLLGAQVGQAAAARRIAAAGSAVAAHRTWLTDYVDRHIRPERFA